MQDQINVKKGNGLSFWYRTKYMSAVEYKMHVFKFRNQAMFYIWWQLSLEYLLVTLNELGTTELNQRLHRFRVHRPILLSMKLHHQCFQISQGQAAGLFLANFQATLSTFPSIHPQKRTPRFSQVQVIHKCHSVGMPFSSFLHMSNQ